MKILTICIPCDNQVHTILATIESCLIKEEDVEVLVVTDNCIPLVKKELDILVERYPNSVRCIENDNHHSLEIAIQEAKGLYFKVLRANDTLDQSSLVKVLETFKDVLRIQANLDMMICDYEYVTKKKKKDRMDYTLALPLDKVFTWHQIKFFKPLHCLTIESVIFKTNILKTSNITLYKELDMYNDALFTILPLSKVNAMCYVNVILQRVEKKVSEQEYLDSVDNSIDITKEMIEHTELTEVKSRKLRYYLAKHIATMIARTMVSLIKRGQVEDRVKKDELWDYLQIHNQYLYKYCKRTIVGKLAMIDNKVTNEVLVKTFNWMK